MLKSLLTPSFPRKALHSKEEGKEPAFRTQTNAGGTTYNSFVKRIIIYFKNYAAALQEIQPTGLDKLIREAGKRRIYTNYSSGVGEVTTNALYLPVAPNVSFEGKWKVVTFSLDALCIEFSQL